MQDIPDEELWSIHSKKREDLVTWARQKVRRQLRDRGANNTQVRAVDGLLDPNALTIGFARRFATYKRATLLLLPLATWLSFATLMSAFQTAAMRK